MDAYEEASLIVQLSRWATEMKLDDALAYLFSPAYDRTVVGADVDDEAVRTVLTFFETVGALVKHGAPSGAFVRDVWWVSGSWELVKAHAQFARDEEGEPSLYENFEALLTA